MAETITISELAAAVGVTHDAIRKAMSRGRIPAPIPGVRPAQFRMDEIRPLIVNGKLRKAGRGRPAKGAA